MPSLCCPDMANGNSALTAGRWKQQTKQELARKYPKGTFKDLGKGRFVILPIYKPGGKKIAEPQVLPPKPLGACLYCRNVRNMLSVIMCMLCYDGECDHADHVVRTLESVNNPVKTGPAFLLPLLAQHWSAYSHKRAITQHHRHGRRSRL